MSPPMSNVPDVDNDCDFVLAKILLMLVNCCADADLSWADDAMASPADA